MTLSVLCLAIPLCGPSLVGAQENQGTGRVITGEEIRKSGTETVWDALRFKAPHILFIEDGRGEPDRMVRRGRSTLHLKEGPLVFVDGVRLVDIRTLARMPAEEVASIEILSGIDATTRYGTDAVSGVILIHTKLGRC